MNKESCIYFISPVNKGWKATLSDSRKALIRKESKESLIEGIIERSRKRNHTTVIIKDTTGNIIKKQDIF